MKKPEQELDMVEQMEREPGTRPVCAALSPEQLKALRSRTGRTTGLKARRLVCPGRGFALTPMGAQWREHLIELERMRRTLVVLRDKLNDGAERAELLDVIAGGLAG